MRITKNNAFDAQKAMNLPAMGTLSAKESSTRSSELTNKKYQKEISAALQQQHTGAPTVNKVTVKMTR